MTPKEKAEDLIGKYYLQVATLEEQKQCALIAVDEIINSSPSLPILGDSGSFAEDIELSKIYWQEVKQEIDNL